MHSMLNLDLFSSNLLMGGFKMLFFWDDPLAVSSADQV